MKKILIALSVFTLLILSTTVFAQNKSVTPENTETESIDASELTDEEIKEFNSVIAQQETNENPAKVGELASCFDYSKFGSININLTQDYTVYEAGDPVLIRGTVKNNNTYPVVGMDIKARLVKDIPEPDSLRSEIITLEDFDIVENITLDAGEEYDVAYSHLLPLNAPSGQYQMYFYVVEQDRYNLAGLSFTNDIVGSKISFDVKGTTSDHVYLDQTQITVGEQEYNVMTSITQHTPNISIPVSIPLYNPDTQPKDMTVTYTLYSFDAANPKNVITSKTEKVTVEPQSEKLLTYTLDKGMLPVYYLSIEAKPTNPIRDESVFKETTISNIRFAIQDTSLSRINFSGVNTYPLKRGTEATLITCFQNINEESLNENSTRIETLITDDKGKELARTVYEGIISLDTDAIIQKFNPKRGTSNFTVSTTMYGKDNKIIDQVNKVYVCEDINPDACPSPSSSSSLIMSAIAIAIIGLAFLFFTRKKMITIERV